MPLLNYAPHRYAAAYNALQPKALQATAPRARRLPRPRLRLNDRFNAALGALYARTVLPLRKLHHRLVTDAREPPAALLAVHASPAPKPFFLPQSGAASLAGAARSRLSAALPGFLQQRSKLLNNRDTVRFYARLNEWKRFDVAAMLSQFEREFVPALFRCVNAVHAAPSAAAAVAADTWLKAHASTVAQRSLDSLDSVGATVLNDPTKRERLLLDPQPLEVEWQRCVFQQPEDVLESDDARAKLPCFIFTIKARVFRDNEFYHRLGWGPSSFTFAVAVALMPEYRPARGMFPFYVHELQLVDQADLVV